MATHPCPCGRYGVDDTACTCTPPRVAAYQGRVSGPLLDRMDMTLSVPRVKWEDLSAPPGGETSAEVRAKVVAARERQRERFVRERANASMSAREVRKHCILSPSCRSLLRTAMERLSFSARAHDRILKVARTIADLDGEAEIGEQQLAEAIQYRGGEVEVGRAAGR